MRTIAAALGCLVVATAATASSAPEVTVLPRPVFPAPVADLSSPGALTLVSSRYHSPADLTKPRPAPPAWAPDRFRGYDLQFAIRQPPRTVFLVYGRDGSSGRVLVAASAHAKRLRYAFDLVNFAQPPNGGWFEQVMWARERDGVLYVETAHLTFASATRGRNAYVSAIDLKTRKTLWRSPALVANAFTFVLAGGAIVAGYGFTQEPDYLYLLDRNNGRVLDRLPLPTAPEIIKLRGDRLHVRTYDHDVVARIRG